MNPEAKRRLHETCRAYWGSAVLAAAVRVGLFEAVGRAARTAREVADALGLDARATEIVLLALAGEGWLTLDRDRFQIAPDYAPCLLSDGADPQVNILRHIAGMMPRWAQLPQILQTGAPPPRATSPDAEESLRDFICGMADISRHTSVEVAEKVDLSGCLRMLDLGGGPGTAAIAFAERNLQLSCVVFDLEGPVAIAQEQIRRAGLADRIETRVADYEQDDFGRDFDLVYVSNIIHSAAPPTVATIVRKAHDALAPGGRIMVKDFFLDDDRTSPRSAALFSVNMLVNTDAGRSYTLTETRQMLADADFGDLQVVDLQGDNRLLVGRKA